MKKRKNWRDKINRMSPLIFIYVVIVLFFAGFGRDIFLSPDNAAESTVTLIISLVAGSFIVFVVFFLVVYYLILND